MRWSGTAGELDGAPDGTLWLGGQGNEQRLNSCNHGAGRAMSRNEARRRFTMAGDPGMGPQLFGKVGVINGRGDLGDRDRPKTALLAHLNRRQEPPPTDRIVLAFSGAGLLP
jgi:hypothetical protein